MLGVPVGQPDFCEQCTRQKVQKAKELLLQVASMPDKQSALHLIRQCLASCKLAYAMRTVPPGFHLSALQEFDQVVRQALEGLLDGDLPDYAWTQAQL
eukprot:2344461-Amphidinium_carterae.2